MGDRSMISDTYSVSGREIRERHLESIQRMMGELVSSLMLDVTVTDICLNPDGKLWVTRLGSDAEYGGDMQPSQAMKLIGATAKTLGQVATENSPIVEGELLTDGSRFEGIIPPIVTGPAFSIRKKASAVFSLATWESRGLLTAWQRNVIEDAVRRRKNILVVGSTGSGKTTFANAILSAISEITPHDRIVIIEDTRELQCPASNVIFVRTREVSDADAEKGVKPITIQKLLRTALRLFPKRIAVGEVRSAEAFDLLMAWTTGHPGGVCTLHADYVTPRAALTRLETMMVMGIGKPIPRLIAEAVGLIICLDRGDDNVRRVTQIVSVDGLDGDDYKLTPIREDSAYVEV
jgi:type IV secretion system protein TrbB